jgi:hypothetical protein
MGVVSQNWQRSANFSSFGFKLAGLEPDWLKIKISNVCVASLHTANHLRPLQILLLLIDALRRVIGLSAECPPIQFCRCASNRQRPALVGGLERSDMNKAERARPRGERSCCGR